MPTTPATTDNLGPFLSPKAPARYAFLIDPRPQLDPEKPLAWTCQLLFESGSPDGEQFLQFILERLQAHAGRGRIAEKGCPIRLDADTGKLVARFKSQQNRKRNGEFWPGPTIVDAMKKPWDGRELGQGSVLQIAYKLNFWDRAEGCGCTLIPTAVQVHVHVPYVGADDGAGMFGEDPDGARSELPEDGAELFGEVDF